MIKKISLLLTAALIVLSFTTTSAAAASDIEGPSVIHKEANQVFTVMDLLSLYDMDVFIDSDGYTGYGNIPGEYIITLQQGLLTKDVTIIVVESWGGLLESNDVLYVTDYKNIYVSNDRMMTLYEIIYYIYNTTGFVDTNYQFRYEELLDEYHYLETDEEGKYPEGEYDLDFRLTYYTGEQVTLSTSIHIVRLQELPGIVIEPPPTFLDQAVGFIPTIIIGIIIFYGLKYLTKRKRGYS